MVNFWSDLIMERSCYVNQQSTSPKIDVSTCWTAWLQPFSRFPRSSTLQPICTLLAGHLCEKTWNSCAPAAIFWHCKVQFQNIKAFSLAQSASWARSISSKNWTIRANPRYLTQLQPVTPSVDWCGDMADEAACQAIISADTPFECLKLPVQSTTPGNTLVISPYQLWHVICLISYIGSFTFSIH